MPVKIVCTTCEITEAINNFNFKYHTDFFRIQEIGRRYANGRSNDDVVEQLSRELRRVLENWGAGERGAPKLMDDDKLVETLRKPEIRKWLSVISGTPLFYLTVSNNSRSFIDRKTSTLEKPEMFDSILVDTLRSLADGLFIKNTNVTYPMKALLLVTGFMPAFDSKVRKGLQRGNFSGMGKTQFILPEDANCSDGMKLTRLPFLLGKCWNAYAKQFNEGIKRSCFHNLTSEPGRVFDILLFMQADTKHPVLLQYDHDPSSKHWYKLE